jgi:hypothetical protein
MLLENKIAGSFPPNFLAQALPKAGWRPWLVALAVLGLIFLVQPALQIKYLPEQLVSVMEDGQQHGFYQPERNDQGETYLWTQPTAYILFDYHSRSPVKLLFEIGSAVPGGGPDTPVIVRANGQEVGRLWPDPKIKHFQPISLTFTPPVSGQHQLKIELEATPYQPPKDGRVLGAVLKSVTLDKSEAWAPLGRQLWLYWLLPVWGGLGLGLAWLGRRFRLAVANYGAILASLAGTGSMVAALSLLWQVGIIDWAVYLIWLFGTLYLGGFFGVFALSLPLGKPGHAGISSRIYQLITRQAKPKTAFLVYPGKLKVYRLRRSWKFWLGLFWRRINEPVRLWFGWRIVMFVIPVVGGLLLTPDSISPLRPFSPNIWMEWLVWSWSHWDGLRYLDIAANGYATPENISFYPLYPHLVRFIAYIINFGDTSYAALAVAGMALSSLASLLACILLYRLARYEYDADFARLSVVYMLAFPTAFFLVAIYTESLFLALALGAFYAARTQRWLLAMLLAGLAILTKNQGIFVPLALVLEYGQQIGWKPRKLNRQIFYFGLPGLALGGWLLFNNFAYGNATEFVEANTEFFARQFHWPWESLTEAFNIFFQTRDSGTWLPTGLGDPIFVEFPLTVAFGLLLLVGLAVTVRGRLRPAYLLFMACCFIQPLLYPEPGNPLFSMPRFLLIIFPAFLLLALAGKHSRTFHYTYLTFSLALLGLLLARFAMWYWVA